MFVYIILVLLVGSVDFCMSVAMDSGEGLGHY
jgi:hypothetical protein